MPLYVYRCDICGQEKEQLSMVDDRDRAPICMVWTPAAKRHAVRMHRVPAAAAFTIGGFNAKNGYSKGQA